MPRFSLLVVTPEAKGLPDPDGKAPAFATFEIAGVDLCVVNALRRAIISDVKTAAIAFDPTGALGERQAGVRFLKNTSVLHNELLGHRLSMVPLGFDEGQLSVFDPARYKFVLRVKNTGDAVINVTTADFKVLDTADAAQPQALRDAIFPPSPITGDHVLLGRLRPSAGNDGNGEELHAECRARLGCGREHTRWSPVSDCHFRNKVDPELFDRTLAAKLAAAAEASGVPAPKAGSPEHDAARRQHAALDGLRAYARDVHGEPAAFEFFLKTESRLRPALLVLEGLRALSDKVRRLQRGLRREREAAAREQEDGKASSEDVEEDGNKGWGGGPGKKARAKQPAADGEGAADAADVTVTELPNMEDFYEIVVGGEDHTLGNLVQGLLYRHWVREGGAVDASFIGYHQPHPLEDHIAFKIKSAKPGGDVRALMLDGLDWVLEHLVELEADWATFALKGADAASSGKRRGWK
jgi:DNA-directed RNA polymerase subunit L